MTHSKNLLVGALLSLFSFFCFASTNTIAKVIHDRIDPFQILFIQNLFGLIIISLTCLFKNSSYKSSHYSLLFLRSLAGVLAFFFVFISVQHISVANATLLINTGPFFIPLILYLYLKESIDHRLWFGIIPGFIGIIFILNPASNIFQWYATLPLISGVSMAVIYISLRQLHHHKEPMIRILFYLFLFATLLTLPLGIFFWRMPSLQDWMLLALISIASFLAQTVITLSLRYGSPKALAPLCYTSVIFAMIFDWLIWNDIPSWISILGTLFIMIGGILALVIENRKANKHGL